MINDVRVPVRGERVSNQYGPVNGSIQIGVRAGHHVMTIQLVKRRSRCAARSDFLPTGAGSRVGGMSKEIREVNEAKVEALIETMYLAAQADGEFTADERAHFVSSVQSLTEKRLEGAKLEQLLARFAADHKKNGRDKTISSLKARLGDERTCKLSLSMAIRMLAADGILRTSEREFIFDMAQGLGIDQAAAADLVKEIAG
jgi:tellurite resistance protein